MSDFRPRYLALGDSALTVVLGQGISRELSQKVTQVARVVMDSKIKGVLDVVPSYASFAVYYDPCNAVYKEMLANLQDSVERQSGGTATVETGLEARRTIRIPVRYDGEDLGDVTARTGLTRNGVVELHTAREYHVYVIGFVPGFAYLGEIDNALVLPRRATPRKRVPAGSVAIAERQTGIYPFSTPGGWHVIGTTSVTMFDPASAKPALLHVGDTVIFESID